MITLKTNDDCLKGFCDLWNAVLQEDTSYENVTLLNGEIVNNIVVLIKVPVLNMDNRSLHPQIYRGDQTTAMTIPFYFPRDFKSKYDMPMILDAMTSVITDTLSIYCSIDPIHRYWIEQNIQHRNEFFLKVVDENLNLEQTLNNLHDKLPLMEIALDRILTPIPYPSTETSTTVEETSHITHKARITRYLYIAPFENVMTMTSMSPFSFSGPITENKVKFISTQLAIVHSIIDNFTTVPKFFSFIKHISSSAKDLLYFPKGSLQDLNKKQLNSIVETAKIPGAFNKNKSIETTFTQMIILNFYITIKECLLPQEFTKIIREEAVSLEVHENIFQSAAEILPHKVTQQLKETLEKCSDLKKFDLEEILPSDILLVDLEDIARRIENGKTDKNHLLKKFEDISANYRTQKAKDNIKIPIEKVNFLKSILRDGKYLNTIVSYYSHMDLLNVLEVINKMAEHLEEVQENEEDTSETLDLLLLSISEHQNNKEDDFEYIEEFALNKKDHDKYCRITGIIKNFTNDIDNQLQTIWDMEDYIDYLNNHETDDAYIETLREQMNEIEEETDNQLIDEETVHKFIYVLIGYYFNFHNTMEILQTVKNSKIPSIGGTNLPLKEKFPMIFHHSFNSFTPISTEFSKNEYKRFCSIIKSF